MATLQSVAPLSRDQIDPLRSPVLRGELPGLAAALDEQTMRDRLQALLFGVDSSYQIERCNPGQAIYLGGDFCGLRYEMEVRDRAGDVLIEPLVIGRVFGDEAAYLSFMADKLASVVELARGRADLAMFKTLAAPIDELRMVVHVFPLDGDLPTLLDATEPSRVVEIMRETLPDAIDGRFTPHACQVDLAHYGRQHRCTLRYTLEGTDAAGAPARQVVYGKVAADGSGERTVPVIAALRERLDTTDVNIPRVLAFRPDLQLLLLEAIPGKPQVARLLKARLAGQAAEQPGKLTLEAAMAACGRIAAAIHGSGIRLGRQRALEDELAWQERNIAALARVSPDLGARLKGWLDRAAEAGRAAQPLPLGFAHGDFTYTQLIFDGWHSGLVDLDTACQAEPALDLGQFLAYQRLAILKDQRADQPLGAEEVERLCAGFLETYIAARGDQIADVGRLRARADSDELLGRLRARADIYEILMLLRLAIHSWQKLKVSRLGHAFTLIEERVACLP